MVLKDLETVRNKLEIVLKGNKKSKNCKKQEQSQIIEYNQQHNTGTNPIKPI
jgi:hypothetical protein